MAGTTAQENLVALSRWIDEGNSHRDPEAQLWGRVAKIAEEHGEAVAALIGLTGQNPRKGVTHSREQLIDELLDVAITALGAVEHLTDHRGDDLDLLDANLERVVARARRVG